jgi:hypothetical protein
MKKLKALLFVLLLLIFLLLALASAAVPVFAGGHGHSSNGGGGHYNGGQRQYSNHYGGTYSDRGYRHRDFRDRIYYGPWKNYNPATGYYGPQGGQTRQRVFLP